MFRSTSTPSAWRRNLIKRLLAVRRGLSTFRHLADTGTHSLTSTRLQEDRATNALDVLQMARFLVAFHVILYV